MKSNILIKISAKNARLKFIECGPKCISRGCTAKCCDAPTHPTGIRVTIHPTEQSLIEQHGGRVVGGFLQPKQGCRICPFKTTKHLCSLHYTEVKPFGCIVSPFKLNNNNTLIIRNRYKLLPCYDSIKGDYAYRVFKSSLDLIFGDDIANDIAKHLDAGGDDLVESIGPLIYDKLSRREATLKPKKSV